MSEADLAIPPSQTANNAEPEEENDSFVNQCALPLMTESESNEEMMEANVRDRGAITNTELD